MRRLKRIETTPEFLVSLFRHDQCFTQKGIPKDAKIVNIYFECQFKREIIWILLESKSFENINEGCTIPKLIVEMEEKR